MPLLTIDLTVLPASVRVNVQRAWGLHLQTLNAQGQPRPATQNEIEAYLRRDFKNVVDTNLDAETLAAVPRSNFDASA